ncbi:MAG: GNAT family N-acetyltransferase [Dongiaceae bacterium]
MEIVDFLSRVHAKTYAPADHDLARYREDQRKSAAKYHFLWRTFLVAERNKQIVGAIQTLGNTIPNLYVDSKNQSQGVGAELLRTAEDRLRKRGWIEARVRAARDSSRVIDFYARNGWNLGESLLADDKLGLPLVEMTKTLRSPDHVGFRQSALMGVFWFVLAVFFISGTIGFVEALRVFGGMPQELANITIVSTILVLCLGLLVMRAGRPRTLWAAPIFALWLVLYGTLLLAGVAIAWFVARVTWPEAIDHSAFGLIWLLVTLFTLALTDQIARRFVLVRVQRLLL